MTLPMQCRSCQNIENNELFETRERVPTLQNTTLATETLAKCYPVGRLEMYRCPKCSFVWNDAFDSDLISYDEQYNNDVSTSAFYRSHLDAIAERLLASVPQQQPISYVEIGCGDAHFMRLLIRKSEGRCVSAIGFDPSFCDDDNLPDNATVYKTFFGPEQLELIPKEANLICSRHTIEHVPDVRAFAEALAKSMTTSDRRLFVETPDADWILRNTAFQDLFYEHCSIFTPHSIARLFSEFGLAGEVSKVYGDQYLLLNASRSVNEELSLPVIQHDFEGHALVDHYRQQREAMIQYWSAYISDRRRSGSVAIWGAASKGVTFNLLLADDLHALVDCAIDLNTEKQGRYLPSTGLSVVSPEEAKRRGIATVIIMNPNYESEIRSLTQELDWVPEFAALNSLTLKAY